MYTPSDRHGYCDTCTHIRAVHGVTGDPRHGPCECCEPTGDTMSDTTHAGITRAQIARELRLRHFDGEGCGDPHSTGACSNCFGPSPMTAEEVAGVIVNLRPAPVSDVTFDNPVTVQGETR